MTQQITICLTNWKRPRLLNDLILRIRDQSLKAEIFLWNNGDDSIEFDADWIVSSSKNLVCRPRWYMASFAKTPFVCIIDDDVEIINRMSLEYMLSVLILAPFFTIIGIEGLILNSMGSYSNGRHLRISDERLHHERCDIVKGKFMLMRREALLNNMVLTNPEYMHEDDIALSSMLSSGARMAHLCARRSKNFFCLPDAPHALHLIPGHYERRNRAAARWFSGGKA